jgi:hypothetical protein
MSMVVRGLCISALANRNRVQCRHCNTVLCAQAETLREHIERHENTGTLRFEAQHSPSKKYVV